MPINAPPEYEKVEARYRAATAPAEQLALLEEMLRLIPKHKGSEKAQAEIKRKISALRKTLARGGHAGAVHVDPYVIPAGVAAGQVAVVGLPNTGKSSILAAVTDARVKVEAYPFATSGPVPGMWRWGDVQIELVDTPPFTADHSPAGLITLLRRADVICVAADAASPESLDQVQTARRILSDTRTALYDMPDAEIPPDAPPGKPGVLAVTHADVVKPGEIDTLAELAAGPLSVCPLDCLTGEGFEPFAQTLWRLLGRIRIYTRAPGQSHEAPLIDPFTLPAGSAVEDLARSIHRDLPDKLRFARIWRRGRPDGLQVHKTEILHDRDIVELHE